jgi:peptidoglycan LD-endopeptidase CwlK
MGFKLSNRSIARLNECAPDLRKLAYAIESLGIPFMVLCGHRNEVEQNEAFQKGNSKLQWPNSKHNSKPSQAMDVSPLPLDWNNIGAFKDLISEFEEKAKELGINIRTRIDLGGGRIDYPHLELKG